MRPTAAEEYGVRRALSQLSRALDERDAERLRGVFTPDGVFVTAGISHHSSDGFRELCGRHGDATVTHANAHSIVEIDGDRASVRSFAMRMHVHVADMPVRQTPVITWLGYTLDELQRDGADWKFTSRTELPWADDILSGFASAERTA